MTAKKHIIIFSHGFGVRKDDGGLFADIVSALSDIETVMFDYNLIDEQNNIITVRPFSEQAKILTDIFVEQRKKYPDATIDLICHSQGSRIAAVARLSGVRRTVLIAPPTDSGIERMLKRYKDNPKAEINLSGLSKLNRSDGSTTIVPAQYWAERQNESSAIDAYNKLFESTELFIIKAKQDNVLGDVSFDGINDNIKIIELDGDHNFTNTRADLFERIKNIII